MRKLFEVGGYVAAVLLIVFGVVALFLGLNGRSDVRDNVAQENIVGTPDMMPGGIEPSEAVPEEEMPDCDVAGELVNNGDRARCFADYMRVHALEATGGRTYAEMGRFLTETGEETNDEAEAAVNEETGRPVENGARQIWVTQTALATALNMAYFAEQVSNFSIVVAIALILAGLGFAILAFAAFRWLPARERRTGTA